MNKIIAVAALGLSLGGLTAPAQAAGNVAYEVYAAGLLEECKPGSVSIEQAHFNSWLLQFRTDEEKKQARAKLLQQGKMFGGNKDRFCAWIEQIVGPTINNMNKRIQAFLEGAVK